LNALKSVGATIQRVAASRGGAQNYAEALTNMMIPYVWGIELLIVLPLFMTLFLSFTEYDGLSTPIWVGLANFKTLIKDAFFHKALLHSAVYALMAVPVRLIGALLLALLLNRRVRGTWAYRVSVYLPTIIPDVAYALIWLWILNPVYGPLNKVLASLGIEGPAWLVQPETALFSIALMSFFQIGEGFVVLLAGLQEVPREYYQAAAVDGASPWQQFRYITLPMIRPWLVLLLIRDIILSTQNTFTPVRIMTYGGPYYATLVLPHLFFEDAFDLFNFGAAAAEMMATFVGIGVLLLIVFRLVRGWGDAGEA
jgi:multiple sugar transport system permease protein